MFDRLRKGLSNAVSKIVVTELKAEKLRPILDDFRFSLIENDVAVSVAYYITDELENRLDGVQVKRISDRKDLVKDTLHQVLIEILTTKETINLIQLIEEKRKLKEPFSILFVGINGTGKTTSIAKVAKFLMKKGYSVVLAGSDTYRPGSIEQLEQHSKKLGVRMIKHDYGADPAAVAYDTISHAQSRGINVVLIDTAGRIQTDRNLMSELAKIKRVVSPDLTILVIDALIGNDAVLQAEEFHSSVTVDGSILTKVDADVKGGASLSVAHITGKPIIFIGVGQNYEDLEAFEPERFTNMILK
ncbi:cell division protein FtsY [miscellaneous Crenarchaeota group-1 archaeon SG8-32-1]|uniref:Signal recognition particle receptor FtsY n=1 Tax=miscellaneous Crenarchaeota group-1 archaeon SG8-32-1 TaxID=1685124 RepID=A0A0M0BZZ1_9ARCH|nr:MAG: cell division protein FtsY [miscellaneous Crenarchaeota group-1 archaeon SG8-32-1]